MTTTFNDEMLGLITVRTNSRARRIIMRTQPDGVVVTIPPHTSKSTVTDTLNRFRQTLHSQQLTLQQQQSHKPATRLIGLDFRLETEFVTITLKRGTKAGFYLHSEPGKSVIVCPPDAEFDTPARQEWLHRVVERALRLQGEQFLSTQLHTLSVRHGLPFNSCKVNVSKGRWGSCSVRKDINLSCYLMLLPTHLREYVMLHELCHTREMNHSPRFWALLDSLTHNRAKALRNELKGYSTTF